MRPAFITFAAKKTVAVVITGTLVVATGSFALAAVGDGDESDTSDPSIPSLTDDEVECEVDLVDGMCPEVDPVDPVDPCLDDDSETECPGDEEDAPEVCFDETGVEVDCSEETEDRESEGDESEGENGETEGEETEGPGTEEVDPPTDGEYRNHGEAVSEAARNTCPKGPGHGACVSEVARSNAGKAPAPEAPEETEPAPVVETAPAPAEESDPAEPQAAHPAAEAKGANGNGNGKGPKK